SVPGPLVPGLLPAPGGRHAGAGAEPAGPPGAAGLGQPGPVCAFPASFCPVGASAAGAGVWASRLVVAGFPWGAAAGGVAVAGAAPGDGAAALPGGGPDIATGAGPGVEAGAAVARAAERRDPDQRGPGAGAGRGAILSRVPVPGADHRVPAGAG